MGASGIRGGVRFKSYAKSIQNLKSYKILQDHTSHQQFEIDQIFPCKENRVTLFLKGITTRTQAEELKGISLYIDRTHLKTLSKDEFYYHDLAGLIVRNEQNLIIGRVKAIVHYGGDSLLSIGLLEDLSSELLVPFRKEFVKEVNQQEKYIILDTDYVQAFLELKGSLDDFCD